MIDLYQEQPSKFDSVKNWFKKTFAFLKNRSSIFYYVLLLLGTAIGFYLLIIVQNRFTSPWSGDYTMQYVPFAYNYYDDWWTFFKTGVFPHWDANIFLGADTVTSDGYYIMFSPFFIPLLFFPRAWIPGVLVLISFMRMVLAGLFFRCYLKKLGISEKFARIGGLAYAFCGYVAYFIWFNNFLDVVVLLAAILWGIEIVLKDKKPWVLAISLGFMGIDNFFFFPAIVIMTFVYSLFRYFQCLKKYDKKHNLISISSGAAAYVLGIMIGGCILLPGLITGMSDPKIESMSYLNQIKEAIKAADIGRVFNLLFNWNAVPDGGWRYQTFPIIELFFPPVTCRHIPLVNYATGNTFDNNAGTLWVGIPMIMFFLPAVIQSFKEKKVSVFIGIGIFCFVLFTPFSYFLLFGGAKAYSRWQIIFPACMIAYVISYLDKNPKISMNNLLIGFLFVVAGIFVSGILAHCYVTFSHGEGMKDLEFNLPFPLVLFIELAYVTFLFLLFILHYQKNKIKHVFTYITVLESVAVGAFVTLGHGFTHPDRANGGAQRNKQLYTLVDRINKQDDSFFRMYTSLNIKQYSDNNQNMNNYNGVSMFNTLYNYNTRAFKYWSRLADGYNGWSAGYVEKRQALDQFLGIKYYVIDDATQKINKDKNINGPDIINRNLNPNYRMNVPFGQEFKKELSSDKWSVFENPNINTIGYGLDNVFTYPEANIKDALGYSRFGVLRNEQMYLEDAIMSEEDYAKIPAEIQQDLTTYNKVKSMDATAYHRLPLQDDWDGQSDSPHFAYRKSYYQVPNSGAYDINNIGDIPSQYDRLTTSQINTIYSNRKQKHPNVFIFIEPKDPNGFIQDFDGGGQTIYIDALFTLNHRSDIYLLDENDNIITFDNHSDNTGINTGWRWVRALYSEVPVKKIAIYPRYYGWGEYEVYTESKASWDERLAKLNPFSNVKYVDSNTFTFDSNFDKAKMGVTNIAYERGWKVFVQEENKEEYEVKPFLADGGFVGFACPKGKVSYRMEYKNPDLVFAHHFTATSFIIIISTYCAYVTIYFERERKRSLNEITFRS